MLHYGILGHPLKHTMSPYLHNALFRMSGTEAEYTVYDLSAEELATRGKNLLGLDGLNITIPYKITMLGYADVLSPETRLFQSVNCFARQSGKTVGHNTDVDGFVKAVEELPASLSGKVLLLGAGGVAQTMAVTAVQKGAQLTIAVREADLDAANALAARAGRYGTAVTVTTLGDIVGNYDLLINATPVGMYPNTEAAPVSGEVVARTAAVFDAVYNPGETKLFRMAKAVGIPVKTGMSMLVYQAVKAHELWYGGVFSKGDVDALIASASAYMEEHFN